MKIYLISNDTFLCQEMMMNTSSNTHDLEVHDNALLALEYIRQDIPDLVIIDNDCDGVNPLVLQKIICRDSRFENTKFHFVAKEKIEKIKEFQQKNGISKLWFKPFNITEFMKNI